MEVGWVVVEVDYGANGIVRCVVERDGQVNEGFFLPFFAEAPDKS